MTSKRSTMALLIAACIVAPATGAPGASSAQPAAAVQPATPETAAPLAAAELEQLLGPIALYPDALLANVLAAAIYPDEVKEAAAFIRGGGDKKQIDSRRWEDPVKAIAKVPDVARMLGEFPDWTTALGQAYLRQPQDVMAAVQALRRKAQANGALRTTDQQNVVVEDSTISIVSPDPEVVYVPYYQPATVYVDHDDDDWVAAGLVGFGAGVIVGAVWADLACDWHHGCIGWGGSDIDIDINRGDVNIGQINTGNRVGREGSPWSPNRSKTLATARPDQLQSLRGPSAAAGAGRLSGPQVSTAGRAPANMGRPGRSSSGPAGAARPAAPPRTVSPAPRQPAAGRVPATPSPQRAQTAFNGGSDARASSSRGSTSRQSAQRNSGGRSSPARGGGRGGGRGGRR